MIKEYLLKKLLDASFNRAKRLLRESDSKLLTTRDRLQDSIDYHLRYVDTWSAEVSFKELRQPKHINEIFIQLDLLVFPRRDARHDEKIESIPLQRIFDYSPHHPIVLGQPGAGKSTSMKYLCQLLLRDDKFQGERFAFPIVVQLRDLNKTVSRTNQSILIDSLYQVLGLDVDLSPAVPSRETTLPSAIVSDDAITKEKIKERLVVSVLDELRVLLILDGFDELSTTVSRDNVISDVRILASHLGAASMVLTSRSGDFVYSIDNTVQYDIEPLRKDQIEQFAIKWLNDEPLALDFLEKIYHSPFSDTAIRPLTLAHLCAIYERVGTIPDRPKSIYKKIIGLLLEDWDQQRSVKRQSRYGRFEIDRKFEFLCHLAYTLTREFNTTVFSKGQLLKIYKEIFHNYDLVSSEAQQVVNELETHTGLFLQSGYETFEFAHKSLQEYLAAEYIVRLPSIPLDNRILFELPNELAIAIAISSSPTDYLGELVLHKFAQKQLSEDALRTLLSRLFLEKPDFYSSRKLGISLTILYSLYLQGVKSKLHLKTHKKELDTFANWIEHWIDLGTLGIISKDYRPRNVYELADGNKIVETVAQVKSSDIPFFPTTLYVTESLMAKLSSKS